jgi:hypothetical protein
MNIIQHLENPAVKKSYYANRKKCKMSDAKYTIIRYDKKVADMTNIENVKTIGKLRSVILSSDNEIVCCSPCKSMQLDDFIGLCGEKPLVEEYIEGTMINMFWDKYSESWEYATKNTIGCKTSFFQIDLYNELSDKNKSFEDMFLDAYYLNGLHYLQFDKTKCYSFVLQHPDNRIVSYISEPKIYLISVYHIVNNEVYISDISEIKYQVNSLIKDKNLTRVLRFPLKYEFLSFEQLKCDYQYHPDYNIMGVVIKCPISGYYTKIRNENYMNVKKMCGNSPSLLHRYVNLYKTGKLAEYLSIFTEHYYFMYNYHLLSLDFIQILDLYYTNIYIKKYNLYSFFSKEEKHHVNMVYHLKQLHKKYLSDKVLYPSLKKVNVAEYVNNLDVDNLCYALKQVNVDINQVRDKIQTWSK